MTTTRIDQPRIVVADDHPLFRQAIGGAIHHLRPGCAIAECGTLVDLHRLLDAAPATLVLLDLTLPDAEGFTGLLSVKSRHPDLPVAIVSASEDATTASNALVCGACGFIPKSAGMPELADALATILAGRRWSPLQKPARIPATALSTGQARILAGLQRGLMNKQIAHELGVTEATVKAHLTVLFRKLGVHSRTQALMLSRNLPAQRTPH